MALVAAFATGCGAVSAPVPGLDLPGDGGAGTSGDRVDSAGTAGDGLLGDPEAYAAALLAGTNDARATAGLAPLSDSACARDAAAGRAAALLGAPALEHAPLDDVLVACAPRTVAAENLSRAAATPDRVVEAWLGSPGHRQNLLSPTVTELGVACVSDGGALLCSQIFLGP